MKSLIINEQDLFDLVKENENLHQVQKIKMNHYKVYITIFDTFYIEKEPDLDDDRWFYWFNSRDFSLKQAWNKFEDIVDDNK